MFPAACLGFNQAHRVSGVRVDVFVTCLADTLFPSVGTATVRLLERLGHEVRFTEAATCCGQMHLNSGYRSQAASIAGAFADAYRGSESEAIVVPSGSCAGALRHHTPHLGVSLDDCPPVYELSEFLVDVLGVTDVGATYAGQATYHPTCHSLRLLGVGDRPQRLLSHVRGLELVDLPGQRQLLRLRRHVRAEERPRLVVDGSRQGRRRAGHRCTHADRR